MTKVCIISLTHNRPDYVKRSFESLYARAGIEFDHYVFDDASDDETVALLESLQNKFNFKFFRSSTNLGIYRNFHTHVRRIPNEYDYYVKFDSDIELLSDNLFKELLEVFGEESLVSGATPHVEGVYNAQRSDEKMRAVQFFNGHAAHIGAPVVYGCCLMFSKKAFESFPRMTNIELDESKERWAIDSLLYEHSLRFGKFVIVEDLSVYHIDNTYGQRKHDMHYFTARNRWGTIDKDEVWFMRLSKDIYPRFLDRSILELLKRSSADNYESFYKACISALKHGLTDTVATRENAGLVAQAAEAVKESKTKLFKVSAPPNFVNSKNLKKGEIRYYRIIPSWVRTDPGVVLETEEMTVVQAERVAFREPSNLVQKEARQVRRRDRRQSRREYGTSKGRLDVDY